MEKTIKNNLESVHLPLFSLDGRDSLTRLYDFYQKELLSPIRLPEEVFCDLTELYDLTEIKNLCDTSEVLRFSIYEVSHRAFSEDRFDRVWMVENNSKSAPLYRSFTMPQAPDDFIQIFLLLNTKEKKLASNNHQLNLLIDYLTGVDLKDKDSLNRYLFTVYHLNLFKVIGNEELLQYLISTSHAVPSPSPGSSPDPDR